MTTQSLPRLFGPYFLTKSLSVDALGVTYRAGTTSGPNLRPFLLVKTFDGEAVDPNALFPAMETAVEYLEEVRGQAVAKGAVLGIVDEVPFAGIEYVPGQTLDRLLRGTGDGVALPIEHALLIAEKILIGLEAGKAFARATGAPHGFLVPAFVNVSNDGDTRTFGAGLGPGLLPSLSHPKAKAAFAPYLAPEVLAGGKPSTVADVYSTAAILLECLTGKAPAPGAAEDALPGAVLALNGNPLPDDIGRLLARGLARDPSKREGDVTVFKKSLGKLLYAGPYAPSTFNLAFFMHQQFDKSIDEERRQLAAEEQLDPRPLLAAEAAASRPAGPRAAPAQMPSVPKFGIDTGTAVGTAPGTAKKGGLGGLPILAVVGVVAAVIAGAVFILRGTGKPAPAPVPTPVPVAVETPTPAPPPTPVIVGKDDPAFQAALQAKLQEEMKKVQDQISREQESAARKRQADLERAAEESRKAREAEEAARLASQRADQQEAARLAKEAEEARAREDAARKAAEAAIPKTKEGDLVDLAQLDKPPSAVRIVKPDPTTLARQRKVSGTVLLRVLVNENGRAEAIEILRDTTPKVGLGDACRRALQDWEWSPAMKDGKRVKTWLPVPIPFRL